MNPTLGLQTTSIYTHFLKQCRPGLFYSWKFTCCYIVVMMQSNYASTINKKTLKVSLLNPKYLYKEALTAFRWSCGISKVFLGCSHRRTQSRGCQLPFDIICHRPFPPTALPFPVSPTHPHSLLQCHNGTHSPEGSVILIQLHQI